MSYNRTIYNNPRQINTANLNKIENKLEELDVEIEELKENSVATTSSKKGVDGKSIVSATCICESVDEGNKLTFTFTLSDDSTIDASVVIPNTATTSNTKTK